jgi:hypothetical protein
MRDDPRQRPREGSQRSGDERPAAAQEQVGQPQQQQRGADPQQGRGNEGPVGHRNRRDTFGREHNLVATAPGQPEQRAGGGQNRNVKTEACPAWRPGSAHVGAGCGDGGVTQVTPRRCEHRCSRDRQSGGG